MEPSNFLNRAPRIGRTGVAKGGSQRGFARCGGAKGLNKRILYYIRHTYYAGFFGFRAFGLGLGIEFKALGSSLGSGV